MYSSSSGLCLELGFGSGRVIKIWGILNDPDFYQDRNLPTPEKEMVGAIEVGNSNILFLWTFSSVSWG